MGGEESGLAVWVIYDHPKDYPDFYVVRKQIAGNGQVRPTGHYFLSNTLGPLRQIVEAMGLTCIPRDPSDDPVIVECWI